MTRKQFGTTLAATMIALTLTACGSDGGTSKDPAPAALTIDDLKPTPDDFFPGFEAPTDRGVPEKYDDVARSLGGNLSQILEVSFEKESTWKLTSDQDVVDAVAAGFGSIGEENSAALADSLLSRAQDKAVDGERLATRYASTFAPATQPTDMFVYKLKWDFSVDEKSGTVTASTVAWAGYEVDDRLVISARQFTLTGVDDGATYSYSMNQPIFGGLYDVCASVADGVLAPDKDDITKKQADSLRAEFADPDFHPLKDSFLAQAAKDADPQGDRTQEVEECLAKG